MIEDQIRDFQFNWQEAGKGELQEAVFNALVLNNFLKTPQGRQIFDDTWKRLHGCVYQIVQYCLTGARENIDAIERTSIEINLIHDALLRWSDTLSKGSKPKP